ncbi:PLP-dependent transferase [Gloeophyllum trabeum ATCC 11539]|uniref:PLP-dependent transferase n=1 Tax=Gloeophyllum trabeum (strain ATCC 11539 / FP-39264 / Madison 617) TaxID=670483 RepID=S7PZ17_GLOTA|nr:PLP-dependent transferase [Gloeophyllum trabeum ATCC 11539]EPQ52718.1 PLP-dependent transferase [Gloeophyllum trabeum ATCC 11539]
MSLLFKNLRVHQVFGANTDVGKTLLTSALVRASATKHERVFYLKPVSTGPMQDADDEHVKRYIGANKDRLHAACLYRFSEPLSPHLAVQLEADKEQTEIPVPSDETFGSAVASHIRQNASGAPSYSHMYVETAGGIHSPSLSGTTQADAYRPLFLPTILIGDSRLGGISSTISAYESLMLRGYIVDCILLFKDEYYRNGEYLAPYFAEKQINVATFDPPPPRHSDPSANFDLTERYYQSLVPPTQEGSIFNVLSHLDACHSRRLEELESMPRRTLDTIWWPFVQHGHVKGEQDVNVIDSAFGDFFSVYNGHRSKRTKKSLLEPQFDGSASWWTQALGHANPALTTAAARAAGRYGHVMFPQATHLPALNLAERLVKDGPGKDWASRAFFSDDGSTGMEIALKMALRAYAIKQSPPLDMANRKELGVLGLKGSYHGDTIGAMDACEEGVYTCEWHNAKGYWFDPPYVGIRKGKVHITVPESIALQSEGSVNGDALQSLSQVYDVKQRLDTPLASVYRTFVSQTLDRLQKKESPALAALVLEPIVLGAGGMIFVDPLFQRILVDLVREAEPSKTLPVIFDEVFVGLYRLGMETSGPLLGVHPDISVHAKILTGGLLPLAVTLASDETFQAFLSENKTDALLHGHSYTAHPVGCEVANETLNMLQKVVCGDEWKEAQERWSGAGDTDSPRVFSLWDQGFVEAISHLAPVKEVMTLGTLLVIKTQDDSGGYRSNSAQALLKPVVAALNEESPNAFGMHFRTLGNVAYFMTSLNSPSKTIRAVEDRIWSALSNAHS